VIARADALLAQRYRYIKAKLNEDEARILVSWAQTFLPFQRCWLFEPSRFAVCNKARQIGISHTSAGWAAYRGIYYGDHTIVVSKDKDAALNVLRQTRKHGNVLHRGGSRLAKIARSNKHQVIFDSGGVVTALPSTGGRSFTGNVVLDEFAYQSHPRAVWDSAVPVASLGHSVRVVSTPNGVGNEFHDLWDYATRGSKRPIPGHVKGMARPNQWAAHFIPLERARADGFKVDMASCWEVAKGDQRIFDQLYAGSFLDNEFQYIPTHLLEACVTHRELKLEFGPQHQGEYFAGLDIGRDVDLTVLVVIRREVRGDKTYYRVVWVECIRRTDGDALDAMVDSAFARFKLRRLCIDQTGLGSFPAQRIKKRHSETIDVPWRRPRVEPLDFTAKSKEELATGLYTLMQTMQLELPSGDAALPIQRYLRADGSLTIANEYGTADALKREIMSLQRKVTKAANIVYETPRTREGHADRAWALMLACHAIEPIHPMVRLLLGQQQAAATP